MAEIEAGILGSKIPLAVKTPTLAEEIINALAQVKGLRVAARTSSFSFKGKESDIRDIGRLLSVASVLEGGVQKAGSRLRVTVQLINIADGFHLWSERFDRNIKDIFAVQDEISMAVVDKLKVDLREGEKEKITKRHTQSQAAHQLFLKGRYYFNRRYQGDMIKAVVFYEKAIKKDPNYALPYVGIGDVFHIFGLWSFMPPESGPNDPGEIPDHHRGRPGRAVGRMLQTDERLPGATP